MRSTVPQATAENQEGTLTGLKGGAVRVVPFEAGWAALFAEEEQRLWESIGHLVLDIQHVGSTAVPGLVAKPIIDIAVSVASSGTIALCRQPLGNLDYLDRGEAGRDGGYLFVKECAPDVRTHHLHLVTSDDAQWANYLRFRDALRAEVALRDEYALLKQGLQEQFSGDRQGYTAAKDGFVRRVLES